MKRTYFKVQLAVILVFGLFAVATLPSCDKASRFNGTTWEGDYEDSDQNKGTIELAFSESSVDITNKFKNQSTEKATASYTYEKKTMSFGALKFKGSDADFLEDYYDGGKWTGTVDKDVMTLRNVLKGETVKFKKTSK